MAMQDMVNFDSVDHLLIEDYSIDGVLGFKLWMNELTSVKERRDNFLREMGFIEPNPLFETKDCGSLEMGLERVVESSESMSNLCSSSSTDCGEGNMVFCGRDYNGNTNLVVDESMAVCEYDTEPSSSMGHREECRFKKSFNKKIEHWWKEIMSKKRGMIGRCKCEGEKKKSKKFEMSRMKVEVNKKRFKELSALFETQEIRAHKGIIWAMKFSPDGQYLASGGQDGIVRVWRVKLVDSCFERFRYESSNTRNKNSGFGKENKVNIPVVIPDKMFHLEELPIHEFHGHTGDVLDLAWSNSNCLLSSSTDKTVRMWRVGSDKCLKIFHHTDYVTCVQFHPIDDCYFISGSIDGKVRIWGVSKSRVLDWADIRDAVTAICYQPDGQGFVVGSLRGNCRFYEAKGDLVELSAEVIIQSSKKSSSNRITGIQFSPEDSQRVMVMSEDSKLRILDKMDVVCKYKGLPKSRCHTSASFTSNGRHIISVGDDCRVYIFNHEDPCFPSPVQKILKIRTCEHFYSEGVSIAVPWSGTEIGPKISNSFTTEYEAASANRGHPGFSLGNIFSSKASATWPEDMLPVFNLPEDREPREVVSPTWGLVIVTAGLDGGIRTFHNYGLPVKV